MNDQPIRQESRAIERRRVLKGGMIEIKNQSSVDCTVKNLTPIGAKLEVGEGYWIPEHFTLNIPSEGIRTAARCAGARRPGSASFSSANKASVFPITPESHCAPAAGAVPPPETP